MTETQRQPRERAGAEAPATTADTTAKPRARGSRSLRKWTYLAVALSLLPVLGFGLLFLFNQFAYVTTDNATVTGTLAQIGPVAAGQVRTVLVDVGDPVQRNQVVATVFSNGQMFQYRPPFDGVVVARYAGPNDPITAGKPIVTVLNPEELWIEARLEEWAASRVFAGQTAEVTLDASGQTVIGHVMVVGSASVATITGQPVGQTSTSGRPRQLVPVRIEVDNHRNDLVYGGLATVKIRLRD